MNVEAKAAYPLNPLVLTERGAFLTTDAAGDIPIAAPSALGLYYQDTRFLSGLEVRLDGLAPPLLQVDDKGYAATLTYGALSATEGGDGQFPPNVLLRRARYIAATAQVGVGPPALRERITLVNYDRAARDASLTIALTADFRDIFAVRGFAQVAHGAYAPPDVSSRNSVALRYTGRDSVDRRTRCLFAPAPDKFVPAASSYEPDGPDTLDVAAITAVFPVRLEPRRPVMIDILIAPEIGDMTTARRDAPFEDGLAEVARSQESWVARDCASIETDDEALNRVTRRSLADLRLLLLDFPTGPYMAAGIPWFAVPFGRDGIITALETLMVNPNIAVGTLRYLAAHQGRRVDPSRDEEPGKIMHEMRSGELVRTGQLVFDPYYGTVDATPLFLVLLGRALPWLGDAGRGLARELAPAVRAALAWLDDYGDPDGDGFVEFERKAGRGLSNQGWKDSGDSLQFPDGAYPEAPIALVEVQGYAYEARLAGAAVLRLLGDDAGGATQEERAALLRARFNEQFWLPDTSCFAQALDKDKRAVPAVTSNAGHALWSGVADEGKAGDLARRLMGADMCAGWGLRTLAADYPSYNPLSYHNGSIWPHDTAIVAAGLKRYGHDAAAAALLAQVVAAGDGVVDARLPELYGGLAREGGERGPVPYPVSCSPQAWAAASPFLLVQSALGLEPDADGAGLRVRPLFPPSLHWVRLRRLRVGGATVDLLVEGQADDIYEVTCARDGEAAATQRVAAGETARFPLGEGAR